MISETLSIRLKQLLIERMESEMTNYIDIETGTLSKDDEITAYIFRYNGDEVEFNTRRELNEYMIDMVTELTDQLRFNIQYD